jgi:hypothetical protein
MFRRNEEFWKRNAEIKSRAIEAVARSRTLRALLAKPYDRRTTPTMGPPLSPAFPPSRAQAPEGEASHHPDLTGE